MIFLRLLPIGLLFLFGAQRPDFSTPQPADDCNGCEYSLKFKKSINEGDDEVYVLTCKKIDRSYDVYKRKAGHWERGDSGKKLSLCEVVDYYCECSK